MYMIMKHGWESSRKNYFKYDPHTTSLTDNWCGTRRKSTRAYAHLLHQLTGFSKSVPPHRKSILVLAISVFFVIDVTFEVLTVEGSLMNQSREINLMQMYVRCGVKRFGGP